ncbi:hypothetical protein D3C75_1001720 [compost metagenome]
MLSIKAATIKSRATIMTRGTDTFSILINAALLAALRVGENRKKKLLNIIAPNLIPKAHARIKAGSSIMP